MGIFSLKMNKEGAVCGMIAGMSLMLIYMLKFKFGWFGGGNSSQWWFGISPEGFGSIAMLFNFLISILFQNSQKKFQKKFKELVLEIRKP